MADHQADAELSADLAAQEGYDTAVGTLREDTGDWTTISRATTTGELLLAAFRLLARSDQPDSKIAIYLTFSDVRAIATQVDTLTAERDRLAERARALASPTEAGDPT